MSLYSSFWLVLGGTVALMGVDLATGLTGRRVAHLIAVGFTVVGLVLAIVLAVRLGHDVVFDPLAQGIHRTLARSVVVLLVPIAVSGAAILARNGAKARRFHRRVAFLTAAVAVVALGTGLWMKSTGRPKTDVSASAPASIAR